MKPLELRFGIRDGERCSATWKLWTEPSARQVEVYLVCRELRGELKASLHERGGCHIAHSKPYFETEARGFLTRMPTRYTDQWERPEMILPGVTHAFQIVTPWWSTTSPIRSEDKNKGIVWIQSAPPGRVTLVDIFLTAQGVALSTAAAKVGSVSLTNGETVTAFCWTADAAELGKPPDGGVGEFYRDKGLDDVRGAGDLRMMGFGKVPDGARSIFDMAVKPLAIRVVQPSSEPPRLLAP